MGNAVSIRKRGTPNFLLALPLTLCAHCGSHRTTQTIAPTEIGFAAVLREVITGNR